MTLKISVTDQSPIHADAPREQAPLLSVELAKACEKWGYHRYWMAEHHNSGIFACPSPEIMIGQIASQTDRIKVGTGGVMLQHYSPYKVAEQFKMLAQFYPGRVDLGIGRAPGGDGLATEALAFPAQPSRGEAFAQQAYDLAGLLRNNLEKEHRYAPLQVTPEGDNLPSLWVLGSSGSTAKFAGSLGLGFVLALFIDIRTPAAPVVEAHQQALREMGNPDDAKTMLALAVICADSAEEAEFVASSRAYSKVLGHIHGIRESIPSPQEAIDARAKMSTSEAAYYDKCMGDFIYGTGEQCRARIEELVTASKADEISVVNVTHSFKDRLRSYELLAQAFELTA